MTIRRAQIVDSKEIATYLMLAMEDIFYEFIGEKSFAKATEVLEELVRKKDNQYSYANCWVVELDQQVVAVTNVYDGADLHQLRKPVAELIYQKFHRDFFPEDETQPGEIYIDGVGVHPTFQGKGLGSEIFKFLIKEYVEKQNKTLGLLVEENNPNAKRLYLKLGFRVIGEKHLMGKKLEHMQLEPINISRNLF